MGRLRGVRLLAPQDPAVPYALDAHPPVREWFGQRLERRNPEAWRAARGRLYEHPRETTKEGEAPTLEDHAPLYQVIPHGCRAGRYKEALDDIYIRRICRQYGDGGMRKFYARDMLGAIGSDLAAVSLFFAKPHESPAAALAAHQSRLLADAGSALRALGRLAKALLAQRAALRIRQKTKAWGTPQSAPPICVQPKYLQANSALPWRLRNDPSLTPTRVAMNL